MHAATKQLTFPDILRNRIIVLLTFYKNVQFSGKSAYYVQKKQYLCRRNQNKITSDCHPTGNFMVEPHKLNTYDQ